MKKCRGKNLRTGRQAVFRHALLLLLLLLVCTSTGSVVAKRPVGNFGGSKQLDIGQLEKDIGVKFSTKFPSKRFDIDYFYQGDLALIRVGKQKPVMVTCPYVVGPMITFVIGTGTESDSYKPIAEVTIDLSKSNEVTRIYVRHEKVRPWPKSNKVPVRKKGESEKAYLKRSTKYWMGIAAGSVDPVAAKSQVSAAMLVAAKCFEQGEPSKTNGKN